MWCHTGRLVLPFESLTIAFKNLQYFVDTPPYITGGIIEGDIRIEGYPKVQWTFARISGYCEQNDVHSPHITVKESVTYSAWLRLPPEIDPETKVV
ncbi:abc transporter g family member 41 [Quercus suber]|uniref:Abc transporter g family member 41 n=1 Tax=Quercus suber TaxID=58331 RepID=A0AAW0JW27_QUESU